MAPPGVSECTYYLFKLCRPLPTCRWLFFLDVASMSHWLHDFLGILWMTWLPKPPPTSSYGFSITFSGRLLELWLRVIMGTTLEFRGTVWEVKGAADPGTVRWAEGELEELGVKVNPERGSVWKQAPPVLVWSGKALLELRFSMEW